MLEQHRSFQILAAQGLTYRNFGRYVSTLPRHAARKAMRQIFRKLDENNKRRSHAASSRGNTLGSRRVRGLTSVVTTGHDAVAFALRETTRGAGEQGVLGEDTSDDSVEEVEDDTRYDSGDGMDWRSNSDSTVPSNVYYFAGDRQKIERQSSDMNSTRGDTNPHSVSRTSKYNAVYTYRVVSISKKDFDEIMSPAT